MWFHEGAIISSILDMKKIRIWIEGREVKDLKLYSRDKREIEIRGRMIGGMMDFEDRKTRILCHNFNGYPSYKNNLHKIKEISPTSKKC